MNETHEDIDLNNDVVDEEVENIDDTASELEELRRYKAEQEEAKLQAERNREAAKRRLSQKQPNNSNLNQSTLKDLEEVKLALKVENLSEQTGFTKQQIKDVLKMIPNATVETFTNPLISDGLKEQLRKASLQANTPGAGKPATVNGKTFKEMTKEERQANFGKMIQG
jgi:glycyl-tRNA synthetase beta subunit